MSSYDICVDTAAFHSIIKSMNQRCNAILSATDYLKRSVFEAGADYQDVNYEKIVEHADSVSRSVQLFSDKIDRLERILKNLEKQVDAYNNSGYKGV